MTEEYSDSVEVGNIISQNPKKDSKVEKGGEVTVVVSKGVDKRSKSSNNDSAVSTAAVTVPNVVGKDLDKAAKDLIASSYGYRAEYEYNDNIPYGTVISQSPQAGTEAQSGTIVNMTVSAGSQPQTTTTTVTVEGDNADNAGNADNADNNNQIPNDAEPAEENDDSEDKRIIGTWKGTQKEVTVFGFTDITLLDYDINVTFNENGTFSAIENGYEFSGTYSQREITEDGELVYDLTDWPGYSSAVLQNGGDLLFKNFGAFKTRFKKD